MNEVPNTDIVIRFPSLSTAPIQFSVALSNMVEWFRDRGLTEKETRKVLEFHVSLIESNQ